MSSVHLRSSPEAPAEVRHCPLAPSAFRSSNRSPRIRSLRHQGPSATHHQQLRPFTSHPEATRSHLEPSPVTCSTAWKASASSRSPEAPRGSFGFSSVSLAKTTSPGAARNTVWLRSPASFARPTIPEHPPQVSSSALPLRLRRDPPPSSDRLRSPRSEDLTTSVSEAAATLHPTSPPPEAAAMLHPHGSPSGGGSEEPSTQVGISSLWSTRSSPASRTRPTITSRAAKRRRHLRLKHPSTEPPRLLRRREAVRGQGQACAEAPPLETPRLRHLRPLRERRILATTLPTMPRPRRPPPPHEGECSSRLRPFLGVILGVSTPTPRDLRPNPRRSSTARSQPGRHLCRQIYRRERLLRHPSGPFGLLATVPASATAGQPRGPFGPPRLSACFGHREVPSGPLAATSAPCMCRAVAPRQPPRLN